MPIELLQILSQSGNLILLIGGGILVFPGLFAVITRFYISYFKGSQLTFLKLLWSFLVLQIGVGSFILPMVFAFNQGFVIGLDLKSDIISEVFNSILNIVAAYFVFKYFYSNYIFKKVFLDMVNVSKHSSLYAIYTIIFINAITLFISHLRQ